MARPRALKVCACTACSAHPGSCPELTSTTRCPACSSTAEARRGSRQARGYGSDHERLRKQWAPKVATGTVRCARGNHLVDPSKPWALDHNDDRTGYLGPSCATCNNSAGGKAAHRK